MTYDISLDDLGLELNVRRIANVLKQHFEGRIDMTGVKQSDYSDKFFSRSIAALTLVSKADVSIETACAAITDSFKDGGVDAIHFDRVNRKLYLVQSKFTRKGSSSPSLGDVLKFCEGVKNIIDLRLSGFGDSVQRKRADIEEAINGFNVKIVLVMAYSGSQPFSKDAQDSINRVLEYTNEAEEVCVFDVVKKEDLLEYAKDIVSSNGVDANVSLIEWGTVTDPYLAYYGQIDIAQLHQIWQQYGNRIFHKNIRSFMADAELNNTIQNSLLQNPDEFWYFNNGITAICSSIKKTPHGGASRQSGSFEVKGLSVVNGAQTIGNMGRVYEQNPDAVVNAKALIRFISVGDGPDDLSYRITRATNTQNRVDGRDFASLDSNQEKIRIQLVYEGVEYVYRSGDKVRSQDRGFDVIDATIALACYQEEISFMVRAKSGIGQFFEDITKPPYIDLFNENTDAMLLWRLVQVMRIVDSALLGIEEDSGLREPLIAQHGNRFILRQVIRGNKENIQNKSVEISGMSHVINDDVRKYVEKVSSIIDSGFPNTYPANTFKNLGRCRDIESLLVV